MAWHQQFGPKVAYQCGIADQFTYALSCEQVRLLGRKTCLSLLMARKDIKASLNDQLELSACAISGGTHSPTHPPTSPIQTMRYSSIEHSKFSIASFVWHG